MPGTYNTYKHATSIRIVTILVIFVPSNVYYTLILEQSQALFRNKPVEIKIIECFLKI